MKKLLLLAFLSLASGDILVSINLSNSINEISDKFISYDIDFFELMEVTRYRGNFTVLSPSYVKLRNFFDYFKHSDNKNLRASDVMAIFQSLYLNKITPVLVLDYDTTHFDPMLLLRNLKIASALSIKECVWQLGESTLDLSDKIMQQKYSEDLKTLEILCESVKKDRQLNWRVAAVGNLIENRIERSVMDGEIEGLDFGILADEQLFSRSGSSVKTNTSLWITVSEAPSQVQLAHEKSQGFCDEKCLLDGLQYAKLLGDAAKRYDVLFFPHNITHTDADMLKQAINNLHSSLIGTNVFNVRTLKASDKKLASVYAQCEKKMSGAVTLMGINYSNTRVKVNTKLSTSVDSNNIISQYMLSVADGQVLLNNEKYSGKVSPALKFKRVSKHGIDFTIPPFSIAFWVIKNAKVKECMSKASQSTYKLKGNKVSTSADKLLKTLAANALVRQRNNIQKSRSKRQLAVPLLPKLDIQNLKFANLMPTSIHQRSIKDVLFNKNTDIYRVTSVDHNPLKSSENPSLPKGDLYLVVNDGTLDDEENLEIEYPAVKQRKPSKQYKKLSMMKQPSEISEITVPYETTQKTTKKSAKKISKPDEIGELFEIEKPMPGVESLFSDQAHSPTNNVELKTVMRELEPTYRQSKKAMLAAKRKLDQSQLMELLRDATLEEIDRTQIKDADDFELIDLTDNIPDYAEYDEDEDGFFSSDKHHNVRTRRAADYKTNEIPKHGDHLFYDDEDDSVESIVNDVHLYLQPRHDIDNSWAKDHATTTTTTTPASAGTSSPLGVRIIDVFTKTLDNTVETVHKNLMDWWNVISPEFS